MGLLGLFSWLGFGISGIKQNSQNERIKERDIYTFPNGTEYKMDGRLNYYAPGGERIIEKFNYNLGRIQYVGASSGKIYYDEYRYQESLVFQQSKLNREYAIENQQKIYMQYYSTENTFLPTEVATDLPIIAIQRNMLFAVPENYITKLKISNTVSLDKVIIEKPSDDYCFKMMIYYRKFYAPRRRGFDSKLIKNTTRLFPLVGTWHGCYIHANNDWKTSDKFDKDEYARINNGSWGVPITRQEYDYLKHWYLYYNSVYPGHELIDRKISYSNKEIYKMTDLGRAIGSQIDPCKDVLPPSCIYIKKDEPIIYPNLDLGANTYVDTYTEEQKFIEPPRMKREYY